MPTPTPAERFATILLWLSRAVAARSAAGLPGPLIVLIVGRIRDINQRIARLAARIRDGRPTPRRPTPRRSPTLRRARRPNPLPHEFGWLLKLVPEAVGYRSQLEYLLQEAEMAALLAAAPAAMARPLRSLCWMLRVSPPPILAPIPAAPQPTPPQAAPTTAPRASPQRPPPSPPPPSAARRTAFAPMPPPARACGPPLPA
jgi:hypothetical protein